MSFYYSPKEKARAMQSLVENLGNTRRTAEQTGISERTIQRWSSEFSPSTVLMASDFEESLEQLVRERYMRIRNTLIDHVESLSEKMYESPETTADLTMDYVRLVDRLVKAEQLASARTFQLIILWEDPEGFVKLSNDIEF